MHARITTASGAVDQLDDALRSYRENLLPAIQALAGFKGNYTLVNRSSGKVVNITLWESEDALNASEAAATPLRAQAVQALGAGESSVETYEVAVEPDLDEGQKLLAALMQAKQDLETQIKRLAASDEVAKLLRQVESSIKSFEDWARRRRGPPPGGSL